MDGRQGSLYEYMRHEPTDDGRTGAQPHENLIADTGDDGTLALFDCSSADAWRRYIMVSRWTARHCLPVSSMTKRS
jgi:hypothetical protein